MKQIPLTQGKVALVDDADFQHFNQWKWHYHHGYAERTEYIGGDGYKSKAVYMHNEIMQPPVGMEVDHRDGDGLNNQRYNLRNSTHAQNSTNRGKRSDNTSGYIGVYKYNNGWMAQLMKDGEYVLSKAFPTAIEAARARDKAAREHFGEFAILNFPEE